MNPSFDRSVNQIRTKWTDLKSVAKSTIAAFERSTPTIEGSAYLIPTERQYAIHFINDPEYSMKIISDMDNDVKVNGKFNNKN